MALDRIVTRVVAGVKYLVHPQVLVRLFLAPRALPSGF